MCGNRQSLLHQWRLRLQEWIGPAFEDPALSINGEMPMAGIQDDLNIFSFHSFAHLEGRLSK